MTQSNAVMSFTVQKGYNGLAKILIDSHADVNYQSNGGKNALMVAAYAGNVKAHTKLYMHFMLKLFLLHFGMQTGLMIPDRPKVELDPPEN